MFEFEACEVLKIKGFTFVNDCFKNKHNEKIGHYGQTLIIHYVSFGKKNKIAFRNHLCLKEGIAMKIF